MILTDKEKQRSEIKLPDIADADEGDRYRDDDENGIEYAPFCYT